MVFSSFILLIDAKFQLIFQAVSVELCPCCYGVIICLSVGLPNVQDYHCRHSLCVPCIGHVLQEQLLIRFTFAMKKVHIVWAKILKIYDTHAGLLKKSAIKRLTIGNWILLLMYGCKKKCAYLANTPPHQFLRYARKNISVYWCCFKIIEYLCARKRYCFLKTNRLR